jgi:hypothetical protein
VRNCIRLQHLLWILPLTLVSIAIACGGSPVKSPTAATSVAASSDSTSGSGATPGTGGTGSSGTGTLSVMIKDSPITLPTAVLVTFSELSAHRSGDGTSEGEWVTVPFAVTPTPPAGPATRTCDLMKLTNAQDVLGIGTLAAGHYTQLRVTITAVKVYFATETSGPACAAAMTLDPSDSIEVATPVDVPSGTLKLNREFTVPDGGLTTILLDFDAEKSIHQTGNGTYKMTPVISVVSVQ